MSNTIGAGIDWGSSNARAWSFDDTGTILNSSRLDIGLKAAQAQGFAESVDRLIDPLGLPQDAAILACGMIGAKGGLFEAPYADCPVNTDHLLSRPVATGVRRLFILPGASLKSPMPDVMRGEETQICGAVALGHDGLFCMPGTHSKWARIDHGTLMGFHTYVTGELFAITREHAIFGQLTEDSDLNLSAFVSGVHAVEDVPLLNGLFQTRSRVLTDMITPSESTWFLSGYLIGQEILAANPDRLPVTLIADGQLAQLYETALQLVGCPANTVSAETCTTTALFRGLQHLRENAV
ncbi:2-dehydro-3-deoxygalactonokinase [Ruegeria sp.]|uniref:2-dehydro-3-deoxygalactonokinase n=1 Tax=Ruegeria sp. TaxID=1879320 RepID=UPI0023183F8F|nr:2-dehydro-3-deoxygalactonokinase [Ruegeria sp.]MDA7963622.1 2-dehydro-3-deoxygalactonokinase [Ruegeria sp.]